MLQYVWPKKKVSNSFIHKIGLYFGCVSAAIIAKFYNTKLIKKRPRYYSV
jgi:hypothetical protein